MFDFWFCWDDVAEALDSWSLCGELRRCVLSIFREQ